MRDLNRRDGLNGSLPHGSHRQTLRRHYENADFPPHEKIRVQRPAAALPLLQKAAVKQEVGTSGEKTAKLTPEIILTQIIADKSLKMAALIKDETF